MRVRDATMSNGQPRDTLNAFVVCSTGCRSSHVEVYKKKKSFERTRSGEDDGCNGDVTVEPISVVKKKTRRSRLQTRVFRMGMA